MLSCPICCPPVQSRKSDDYFLTSGDKVRCFFEEDAFDQHGKLRQNKKHSINKIGHAMHELDPVFRAFSDSAGYRAVALGLGLRDPRIVQSMYIFKSPFIGGEVKPHQDSCFLYTEPQTCLGLWIGVERSSKENGCLWAVPGSHKHGLRNRFVRDPADRTGGTIFTDLAGHKVDRPEELSTAGAVPLEVEAGTLVALHGRLVHFSYKNNSHVSRHAYTLHILDAHGTVYDDRNWLLRAPYQATALKQFPAFSLPS
eukprot:g73544.t1